MTLEKLNKGELFECLVTTKYGFKWNKDNVKYNQGSDIEQLKMSIKYRKASIMSTKENIKASECNDNKRLELIETYIQNVVSETFFYGYCMEYGYKMDKLTFKKFLLEYSRLDNDSKTDLEKLNNQVGKLKLRLKDIPVSERKWLDKNAEKVEIQ